MINKNTTGVLPSNLHYILIGLLLGDGSLYRSSVSSNTRLEMSFGTNYKEFSEHVGTIFKEYMKQPVKMIEVKGKNKVYINYRLKTRSLPVFNYYYDIFYKLNPETGKYIKTVPKVILTEMNPIMLAYLIMSDGNFDKSRKRVRIYTNSFTKLEVELVQKAIIRCLDLYVGILHDRKDQWILTIGATQLDKLRKFVSPHIESSLLYRIGL